MGYCLKSCKTEEIKKGLRHVESINYGVHQLEILKSIFEEKKKSPFDLGYWVDYTFKYGTEHLNPYYMRDVPMLTYFDFDVYLFLFAVVGLTIYLQIRLSVACLRCCCCRKKKQGLTPGEKNKQD